LNGFGFSPEFPLPIQIVSSFLLTQTDHFVRTYKRNSPFDRVLCAIKTIIKSAIRQRRTPQLKTKNSKFKTVFTFSVAYQFSIKSAGSWQQKSEN